MESYFVISLARLAPRTTHYARCNFCVAPKRHVHGKARAPSDAARGAFATYFVSTSWLQSCQMFRRAYPLPFLSCACSCPCSSGPVPVQAVPAGWGRTMLAKPVAGSPGWARWRVSRCSLLQCLLSYTRE